MMILEYTTQTTFYEGLFVNPYTNVACLILPIVAAGIFNWILELLQLEFQADKSRIK